MKGHGFCANANQKHPPGGAGFGGDETAVVVSFAQCNAGSGIGVVGGDTITTAERPSLDDLARDEESDIGLVGRCRQGDVSAFGRLVERHKRAVYAVVSRMIDNRDDVDDVVQDVFVSAYRALSSFQGNSAFSTWIYRIAVNTTIKQMKKSKVRRSASIDDPLLGLGDKLSTPEDERPDELAERGARDSALMDAIEQLPEKHRVVIVLHYFENLGCDEIASIMECSVGTVWSRLHYACRKLKDQLDWLAPEASS